MTKKVLLSLLLFMFFSSPVLAAWNIWLDTGLVKYRQGGGDGTSGNNTLTLKCAKNEFEPFQVFIYANGEALTDVNVTVSNFTDGQGHTIDNIYIYKELYMNITILSRGDYETGYWPDALIPKVDRYYGETRNAFPFSISSGNTQGVWVDVGTTSSTVAGTYTSTVTVSAQGKDNITGTITLIVWDFTLPSTSTLKNVFTMETNYIDEGHGLNLYGADLAALKAIYMKSYLYHRIGCSNFDAGGGFISYNESGEVTNWTNWMTAFEAVMDGTAITSGPYANAKMSATDIYGERYNTATEERYRTYLKQWWDKFKLEGWDPMNRLYLWTIDEPDGSNKSFRGGTYTDYQVILIKAVDMNAVDTGGEGTWKNAFVTADRRDALWNPGGGYTSLDDSGFYCAGVKHYAYRPPWQSSSYKKAREDYPGYSDWPNDRHWCYTACGAHGCNIVGTEPYQDQVDIMIDTPAFWTRAFGWVWWKYRARGNLYYCTNLVYGKYGSDPYYNQYNQGGNGDGNLYYPGVPDVNEEGRTCAAHTPSIGGTQDIPIESIRLKLFRESMEDYEYMELLRKLGHLTDADTYVDAVFTNANCNDPENPKCAFYCLNTSVSNLFTQRENIANLILTSGGDSEPPFQGGTLSGGVMQ